MLKKLFGRNKDNKLKENEVRVVLPEEKFGVLKWNENGLPCVAVLNTGLKNFEHKGVFSWHLTLTIQFKDLIDNGMPSQQERDVVDPFCDKLDIDSQAGGNALFLIRETWNESRTMIWRVYDPEVAHSHLQSILKQHQYPREFDYRMEQDQEWEQASWYFQQLENQTESNPLTP
ncbi:MAG: DUF695 domain-containing protein [Acidiferrobacterales bacterium]|nr:DUF695 domain-containing protein [Acidiferrobacterales bacterium]